MDVDNIWLYLWLWKLLIKIYVIVLWDIGWSICDDKMMLMMFGCIY